MSAEIPNRLVFIWFGSTFSYSQLLAVRSAVRTCRPDETLIVNEGLSVDAPNVGAALREDGVRLVDAGVDWFHGVPRGEVAAELYDRLESPAARANLLRLAVLHREGGVYLDFDTLTVRDLAPLRAQPGFCGLEHVTMPHGRPTSWRGRLSTRALQKLRGACARSRSGVSAFERIERWYPRAVNNAVLGLAPGSALAVEAFQTIAELPMERRHVRFALGTHLLQQLTGNRSRPDVTVYPPPYFYPLGPRLSAHWFRARSSEDWRSWIRDETHVLHWYASNEQELADEIDRAWVRRHAGQIPFATLAAPFAD